MWRTTCVSSGLACVLTFLLICFGIIPDTRRSAAAGAEPSGSEEGWICLTGCCLVVEARLAKKKRKKGPEWFLTEKRESGGGGDYDGGPFFPGCSSCYTLYFPDINIKTPCLVWLIFTNAPYFIIIFIFASSDMTETNLIRTTALCLLLLLSSGPLCWCDTARKSGLEIDLFIFSGFGSKTSSFCGEKEPQHWPQSLGSRVRVMMINLAHLIRREGGMIALGAKRYARAARARRRRRIGMERREVAVNTAADFLGGLKDCSRPPCLFFFFFFSGFWSVRKRRRHLTGWLDRAAAAKITSPNSCSRILGVKGEAWCIPQISRVVVVPR